jgi:hypothetical protein
MDINDYQEFLSLRRKLMAYKIKSYYYSLWYDPECKGNTEMGELLWVN